MLLIYYNIIEIINLFYIKIIYCNYYFLILIPFHKQIYQLTVFLVNITIQMLLDKKKFIF